METSILTGCRTEQDSLPPPFCLFCLCWNFCLVPSCWPKYLHSRHPPSCPGSLDSVLLFGALPLNAVPKIHTKVRTKKQEQSHGQHIRKTCRQKCVTENPSQITAWTSSVLPSFWECDSVSKPFVQTPCFSHPNLLQIGLGHTERVCHPS